MHEIFALLENQELDITQFKRPDILLVLKRKALTQKEWIISSFTKYQFTSEEYQQVTQAILNGDLRVSDLLTRGYSHYIWSFFTFKWGVILGGGKRLSKETVLEIAKYSSQGKDFQRSPSETRNGLLKGVPLIIGKVATSMALCMVFCLGLLANLGTPFPLSITIAVILSLCNGLVCLLSRGKAMLESASFQPQKQKTSLIEEENTQPKTILNRGQKLFFGIVTLFGCISAGISGYAGISGLLNFLGLAAFVTNPIVLSLTLALCVITAISFYSFQAIGIRENYTKFKNLFLDEYQKTHGILRIILLGLVSTVFLAVYATITWFTTVSGVNKLFDALGVKQASFLPRLISIISTVTTMVVNTFSQVYKVFNPQTYVDLREKFSSINHPPEHLQSNGEKIRYKLGNILKLCALVGDSFAYSVAGGIRSGMHVGDALGEKIGARLTLTIIMGIFAPIILVFVSVAFTWPTVFERRSMTDGHHIDNLIPESELKNQSEKISIKSIEQRLVSLGRSNSSIDHEFMDENYISKYSCSQNIPALTDENPTNLQSQNSLSSLSLFAAEYEEDYLTKETKNFENGAVFVV